MKISLILLLLGLTSGIAFGQTEKEKSPEQSVFYPDTTKACNPKRVYAIVEKMPEYKGGFKQLELDLKENLVLDKKVSGRIYLGVYINCQNFAYAFQVMRGINEQTNNKLTQELNNLQNWTSGIHDNNPVNCQIMISIEIKKGIISLTNK